MTNPAKTPRLHPRLVIAGATRAIEFYKEAFGAEEIDRYTDSSGRIVHAQLSIGGAVFTVSEEQRQWKNDAPPSLGGSPVILTLSVDDADAVGARMVKAGATVVI